MKTEIFETVEHSYINERKDLIDNSILEKKKGISWDIARPLMSSYLTDGYKQEDLYYLDANFMQQKKQLISKWKVKNPYPSREAYHLSGHTTNMIIQQSAIMYILLDLGFSKKEYEIWVNKMNLLFFKPITNPDNITCTLKCRNRSEKIVEDPSSDIPVVRYIYDFKVEINRYFKVSGFGIIEVPVDKVNKQNDIENHNAKGLSMLH